MAAQSGEPEGKLQSYWVATAPGTDYPPLSGDLSVDVAIIGGGIVGITSALLLKEAGLKVALIESSRIARGVSGQTTAKGTSLHRLIYKYLLDHFGHEKAQQYAQANQLALEKVASLVNEHNIDCAFVRQEAYTYALRQEDVGMVQEEVDAARSLGLPASYVETEPLPFKTYGAVRFDNQAQFHPRKYLLALASLIPGKGSNIYEDTRALELEGAKPFRITTSHGKVVAPNVIVATHFPVFDKSGFYFARMYQSRSYLIATHIAMPFPGGMHIDAVEEGLSYRSHKSPDGEVVIMVDSSHQTGMGGDIIARYRKLEEDARKIFQVRSVDYRWSTQDTMPIDRVPYIGQLSDTQDHLYVATGFAKWGMTNGTAAGMILADMVQGKKNPFAPVFDPLRFKPLTAGKTFVEQNLHNIQHFIGDRLHRPKEDITDLKPGEGNLVRSGNDTVAAYKDEQGKVYQLDPTCTHMGCIVTWNNAERSWDCPCHGSRFNYDGQVRHSPAIRDLKKKG